MLALDRLFIFAAIGGGALFVIQLVLLFLGGHADVDVDSDYSATGDAGHAHADVSFKALSLQGITAFFMMFGLVGWAMREDSHVGPLPSLVVAVAAGSASTWLMGRLFKSFQRLQSTGNVDMKQAQGAIGVVYLTVGKDKPGKVNVTVGSRMLTLDAITEADQTLPTGTPVVVTRVISDTTVSVERN